MNGENTRVDKTHAETTGAETTRDEMTRDETTRDETTRDETTRDEMRRAETTRAETRRDETTLSPVTIAIERAIQSIPRGQVSTYGRVARAAGLPNGARQVARVLHSRTAVAGLRWYRVLGQGKKPECAKISLTGAGYDEQRALLSAEGIAFGPDGTVDLEKFGV